MKEIFTFKELSEEYQNKAFALNKAELQYIWKEIFENTDSYFVTDYPNDLFGSFDYSYDANTNNVFYTVDPEYINRDLTSDDMKKMLLDALTSEHLIDIGVSQEYLKMTIKQYMLDVNEYSHESFLHYFYNSVTRAVKGLAMCLNEIDDVKMLMFADEYISAGEFEGFEPVYYFDKEGNMYTKD